MDCSASVSGNIFFWLFWIFFFLGIAASLFAAMLVRKRRGTVTGALFALTGSAAAVLITIFLVDLSAVSWSLEHLWFSLLILLIFFLIWSFKKYAGLPFLVIALLFSLQLNRILSPWLCIQDDVHLGDIKVHLLTDNTMTLSIDASISLLEVKGAELFFRYRVLEIDPRLFFLPPQGFLLLESIVDYRLHYEPKVLNLSNFSGRFLSAAGLWEVIEKESSKVRPLPFTSYQIRVSGISQEPGLDIIHPSADR
jgi:hypothetical protein